MSDPRTNRAAHSTLLLLVLGAAGCGAALAQQTPTPAPVPPPEQLEPGVDTSAISTSGKSATATDAISKAVPSAPVSTPAPAPAPASAPARASGDASRASTAAVPSAPTTAGPAAANRAKKGADRLELEATDITGNRELPKVLYIVPWKRADLGDLIGKPTNSLLDEVLQPIDRDVFQRENRYYDALKTEAAPAKAPAGPLSGGKP